jgi:hypothetical protein
MSYKPSVTPLEDRAVDEYWIEKDNYWLVKEPNRMGLAGPMYHTRKVQKEVEE